MSSYHHSAEVRPHARRGLVIALVLLVVGGCLLPFWWTVIFGLLGGVLVLIGALMLVASLGQLLRGGGWVISATPERLTWRAPAFAERSFEIDVPRISHIEQRIKTRQRDDGRSRTKRRYFLHAANGQRYSMHPQSGVELDRVLAVLAEAGVPTRETQA